MFNVVHPPAPPTALERIRVAMGHCRHAGIVVRVGDLGTAVGRDAMPWLLSGAMVVNPLGAVLIAYQPPPIDPYDAAAVALGCELTTVAGIRDGLDNKRPTVEGWAYAEGYAVGLQLRAELHAAPAPIQAAS